MTYITDSHVIAMGNNRGQTHELYEEETLCWVQHSFFFPLPNSFSRRARENVIESYFAESVRSAKIKLSQEEVTTWVLLINHWLVNHHVYSAMYVKM